MNKRNKSRQKSLSEVVFITVTEYKIIILNRIKVKEKIHGEKNIPKKGLTNHKMNKSWRMRIFGARIFSKSFGGKIKIFNKDCHKMKKLAHAHLWRPYFSKFFGGKIKIFDMGYPKVKLDNRDKF